jgi:hypothetical protein
MQFHIGSLKIHEAAGTISRRNRLTLPPSMDP